MSLLAVIVFFLETSRCAMSNDLPILVVGSMNADFTMKVARLPQSGENIVGHSPWSDLICGGKGLNQAVAASRLQNTGHGRAVHFIAQFGNDVHSTALERCLTENNVNISGSSHATPDAGPVPSGQGYVFLQDDGTVSAVIVGGSNVMWPLEPVTAYLKNKISESAAVLLQREIPEHVNIAIVDAAYAAGVITFLDIGGEDRPISDDLLAKVTFVTPNLSELARLTKLPVDTDANVLIAARSLQARGAKAVLVTRGSDGALLLTSDGRVLTQSTCQIPGGVVVDETGAGDSFRAAFAVAHAEGQSLEHAMDFAAAAGACAVSKHGAASSLPSRTDVSNVLAQGTCNLGNLSNTCRSGATCNEQGEMLSKEHLASLPKFASRLNSMSARMDLWSGTDDVFGWIARQGMVQGLDFVDLNFPQHFEIGGARKEAAKKMAQAVKAAGLSVGAINMRYPKKFRLGAFSNPDESLRAEAISLTIEGGEWAKFFGADELVVWSAFDGYDYHMQSDYLAMWQRTVVSYREVCDALPSIKVSFEYKPTDPSSRFAVAGSAGAALLLAREVNRPNMGITVDVGHCLMAGENPAQSVALIGDRLFGVHLNDGHSRIGAEDGLMVGSVHSTQLLELMYWLQRIGYQGHLYMDTFPENEDPVREAAFNIRRATSFWRRALQLKSHGQLDVLLANHDTIGVLELLESDS